MSTYYLLSLGCPKNEVDAENMALLLQEAGYQGCKVIEDAEILIVNTCGFLEAAVAEAIDAILDMAGYKDRADARARFLIVCGCMSQRYKAEIFTSMPEVDAVLGTAQYGDIVETVKRLERGEDLRSFLPGRPGSLTHLREDRIPSNGRQSYAYLKIAEGCSNACSYCKIPSLRGGLLSRSTDSIVREAEHLVSLGKRELILIAQDTTRYGYDLGEKNSLAKLIQQLLDQIEGIEQIRIMYAYADAITEELTEVMATNDQVCKYLDLPIQHASNKILKSMRRHESAELIAERIQFLRQAMPEIILRSTVMLGFPGETEEDFKLLLDFVEELQFDRLGSFVFSAEEGTPAASMPDQVDPEIAADRYQRLMQVQEKISLTKNLQRVGDEIMLRLDDVDDGGILFRARSYGEAPDIDPIIHLASTRPDLTVGSWSAARIVDAEAFDLWGVTLDECSE
ncbi:MAG: 30S ribosomal protein S12 methylthiotransferase RimO [Clostridiaceae bacterium]|nr:30S ribosomal protein S12 methylthiotransferase RimO [Clostridiaceae bacterium]